MRGFKANIRKEYLVHSTTFDDLRPISQMPPISIELTQLLKANHAHKSFKRKLE